MFQYTKGPLYLDGTVHSIADPCFAGDVFQRHFSFFDKDLRDLHMFWFAGPGTLTAMVRAAGTILAPVSILMRYIACDTGLFPAAYIPQDPAKGADIAVRFFDVGHVFTTAYFLFEAAFLPLLVGLRLYVWRPSLFLQPEIVFFVLVAGICSDGFIFVP